MLRRQHIVTLLAIYLVGCSAWIDDFQIDEQDGSPDTGTSTTASETDVDTDSDSDTPTVACGIMVDPPSGSDVEFCYGEGGSFSMGCDESFASDTCQFNEIPRHSVSLSPFIISRYEITISQFESFVGAEPQWAKSGSAAVKNCTSNYLSDWPDGVAPPGMQQRPVSWICWHAANAFCEWLDPETTLPSEAQWEYAARANTTGQGGNNYKIYPFGNEADCTLGNYDGCVGSTMNVGETTGTSPFGLYDMGGNVWELIGDWHRDDYYCDPEGAGGYVPGSCNDGYVWVDPIGDKTGTSKGVRGGSWYHATSMMRAAEREGLAPNMSSNLIGFRCAGLSL